jgi:hypothetical protein
MSRLGDFLESVYGPADGFKTVRASIRRRRNRRLAEGAGGGRPPMGKRKPSAAPGDSCDESLMSVWIVLPDRLRIESSGAETHRQLEVINGDQSWTRDDQGHVEIKQGDGSERAHHVAGATDTDRHFSHASLRQFFVALALEAAGEVQAAGYDCIRLRARLRPDESLWPHWLPCGADEYEFHVEPTRGVVLSVIAKSNGQVFETHEVTEVVFDEAVDDALFRYEPRQGEQVRPETPIVERLSLPSAINRVSFTVLVPERLPDSDRADLTVMFHPPRIRSPRPYLSLMYRWDVMSQNLWLNEAATPDSDRDNFEWEPVSRHGRELRISDPGVEGGYRVVELEQAGTHVTLWSDMPREPLLDVAASLVPANV